MKRILGWLLPCAAVATLLSCAKSKQETESPATSLAARERGQQVTEHIIPMSKAIEYSRRFIYLRDTVLPAQLNNPGFMEGNMEIPFCETFCRESIDALLAVEGTESVRIYFGVDESGKMRLVLLPVDDEGNNIITTLTGESSRGYQGKGQDEEDGEAVENGHRPPPPMGSL
jgi:hypothetical protein